MRGDVTIPQYCIESSPDQLLKGGADAVSQRYTENSPEPKPELAMETTIYEGVGAVTYHDETVEKNGCPSVVADEFVLFREFWNAEE